MIMMYFNTHVNLRYLKTCHSKMYLMCEIFVFPLSAACPSHNNTGNLRHEPLYVMTHI